MTYQELHKELTDVIGVLDEKVDGVLERHEMDFFAAYRVIVLTSNISNIEAYASSVEGSRVLKEKTYRAGVFNASF